jgi:hypothetical protein
MPFHFNSALLESGSIIRPGNWGRIVRLIGYQHREWQREAILERIRETEFRNLPSRRDCIFFFDDEAEAEFYGAARGEKSFMILYEVELVDPTAIRHEADWKGTGPYDNDEWARRYWRGEVMPGRGPAPAPLCREVLAVTPLRIMREVPR